MNVLVLDGDLKQISIISSFISLTFNRQFSNIGSFEISVNLNSLTADALKVDRIIYLDPNRCGIIERIEVTRETNSGGEVLVATGIEIKDIICRRITIPPIGHAREEYIAQSTEIIVRGLLSNHIIAPTDSNRAISIYELGNINNVGDSKDFSTRYSSLDGDIYELLSEARLGLIYHVDLRTCRVILEINEGLQRTIDQNINPTAIFALKLGTSNRNVILHDKQSLKNVAYIGGAGEDVDRTVLALPSENAPSGINRRELFVSSNNAITEEELITRGNVSLSELGSIYQVNAVANSNVIIQYDLGDKVTLLDYKTNAYDNLQMTGIVDTYSGAAPPQRSITFGRAPLSMAQAINSRLKGINNILTK